jgi:hypothetical protein
MFTVDLLNGRGIPVRSGPERVTVATAAFGVPLFIAIIMVGWYLSNSITISVKKQAVANYEARLKEKELADAIEAQRLFEKEKGAIYDCLSEVSACAGGHVQWSPILDAVVQNMPDSLVLTRLEAQEDSVKRTVLPKDGGKKTVDVAVPLRKLRMTVSVNPQAGDKAVQDYRDSLLLSAALASKLEDIRVSQTRLDTLDGQKVVSHDINFLFKPGL